MIPLATVSLSPVEASRPAPSLLPPSSLALSPSSSPPPSSLPSFLSPELMVWLWASPVPSQSQSSSPSPSPSPALSPSLSPALVLCLSASPVPLQSPSPALMLCLWASPVPSQSQSSLPPPSLVLPPLLSAALMLWISASTVPSQSPALPPSLSPQSGIDAMDFGFSSAITVAVSDVDAIALARAFGLSGAIPIAVVISTPLRSLSLSLYPALLLSRSPFFIDGPSGPAESDELGFVPNNLNSLTKLGDVKRVPFGSDLDGTVCNRCSDQQKGWNVVPPQSFFHFLLKECCSYKILLLLISAGLCLGFGMSEQGPKYGWLDGFTILVVSFLLVIVPSVTNFHGAKILMKKQLKKKLEVIVVREEERRLISASDVVEGDVVHLSKGDQVPSDGFFASGDGLVLDEVLNSSLINGGNPSLFSGSKVIHGNGRMIVTSVSTNTVFGKLMGLVTTHDPNEVNLLEAQIKKPNDYAEYIGLCISIIVMLVQFLRFIYKKEDSNSEYELTKIEAKGSLHKMMKILEIIFLRPQGMIRFLTTSLASVLLGLQESVTFVIKCSLSYWNRKVEVSAQADPTAACTMAMATVLCINSSGGLLCHQLVVKQVWIGDRDINDGDNVSATSQALLKALQCVVSVAEHEPQTLRTPTDGLLISWLSSKLMLGMYKGFPEEGYSIMHGNDGENNLLLHKGDASIILPMCSHYYDCQGNIHGMGNQRSWFEKVIKDMEENCITPIAFAYTQNQKGRVQEIREDGLNLLAVVGFKENPCWEAVKALVKAGVSIKLVSRDEPEVLIDEAYKLGICVDRDDEVIEGVAFQRLDDHDRIGRLDHITMMYKSDPEDTLLMLKALKQKGHVVAYFGGMTTSEVAALKEADVGITEETRSTQLARESSDIIVPSNSGFNSFITIFKSGRCVYSNIQKFNHLMVTGCISGLLVSSIATMCFGESPITAIQLLWVNWIMCVLGGLMMVMELPVINLITHEPEAKRAKSFMSRYVWRNHMTQFLYQTVGLLIFLFAGQAMAGLNPRIEEVMIFNCFTLCQLFNLANVMELEKKQVLKVVSNHYWFLGVAGAVLVLQVLVVEFGTSLANYVSLTWVQWSFCFYSLHFRGGLIEL
ncbi:hypothetical protein F0562_008195 [Nyssa sinensis]|uniref:Uncharacterized protein n=1 Tax=Nyssa sinensis TaxID=561372 RepID=A0A5J5A9M9_9ASTE|nr:hypothetical protein F0562_008195 [Nyssa sinensis]